MFVAISAAFQNIEYEKLEGLVSEGFTVDHKPCDPTGKESEVFERQRQLDLQLQ